MSIKAGFSLEPITVKRIEALSKATRLDKSAVVDVAIEKLAQTEEFAHLQTTAPVKALTDIQGVRKGAGAQ